MAGIPSSVTSERSVAWWRLPNRSQWFVFLLAAFGWLFDCFDQQIFTLSRSIAMRELLPHADSLTQTAYGGYATSIFILGWATGGLCFGIMGDRWGRAKTMALTILWYALFTGLSGLAQDWGTFAFFRFLTGAGVGGEFAVGTALVAEIMPDRARPHALGTLQALSTVGNILAAVSLGFVVPSQGLGWGWRGLYYLGAIPALVAVVVFWRLKEPERWVAAREAARVRGVGHQFGSYSELFRHPRWRRNALVGLCLAVSGVLGLWGVAFYSPELIDSAIPSVEPASRAKLEGMVAASSPTQHSEALGRLSPSEHRKYLELLARVISHRDRTPAEESARDPLSPELQASMRELLGKAIPEDKKTRLKSVGGILQQVGAFCGMYCFTLVAARVGRRVSFLWAMVLAWGSLILTFACFHEAYQIYYLWPILGFCTLAPFGLYAIYFPELFPTRLRTTGTSFCYNVGRYLAALGPFVLGPLARSLDGLTSIPGFRLAAMVLASSYLLGVVALIWAPETVGQPLPEEEPMESESLMGRG